MQIFQYASSSKSYRSVLPLTYGSYSTTGYLPQRFHPTRHHRHLRVSAHCSISHSSQVTDSLNGFQQGKCRKEMCFPYTMGQVATMKVITGVLHSTLGRDLCRTNLIQQECYKQKQRTLAALRNTRWYFRGCIYESNLMPQNVLSKCETIKDNLTISTKCNWGPCCMVSTNSSLSEYLYYANIIQK